MENKIKKIYDFLLKKKYITGIYDATGIFSDEPQFPYYITLIHPEINFYNRNGWDYSPTGNTWNNSELALLKCVMEMLERTSQFYFDFKTVQFYKENQIKTPHIDLRVFFKDRPSKKQLLSILPNETYGWLEGINVTEGCPGLIPAQLIYPNYASYAYFEKDIAEPTLVKPIYTYQGSAGGFDHESTLLRAIYEVVEREARTLFLASKHKAKIIEISQIQSQDLNTLLDIVHAYNFKVYAFNIMNDLRIPVIMTLLVDKSGIGPVVNTGFKAGLKFEETLLGSIEDAFYQRFFQRVDIIRKPKTFKRLNNIQIINNKFNRSIFISDEIYERLLFQFSTYTNDRTDSKEDFFPIRKSAKQELSEVIKRIKVQGFDIWNYTFNTLKNVYIYKVIIPGLQPSLRNEPSQDYFQNRLQDAKEFYKKSTYYV